MFDALSKTIPLSNMVNPLNNHNVCNTCASYYAIKRSKSDNKLLLTDLLQTARGAAKQIMTE